MNKIKVFSNTKSDKKVEISLPKELVAEKVNQSLVDQAKRVYEAKSHIGSHKTKTRAEISRTKAKWFRQKGTGRARHGARSAPIFVGGGTAHGPKGVKRVLTLPSKFKTKALQSALLIKLKENKVFGISEVSKINKTKEFASVIKNISAEIKFNKALVVLSSKNLSKKIYMKNIKNVDYVEFKSLNAFDILKYSIIVFDTDSFEKKEAKQK